MKRVDLAMTKVLVSPNYDIRKDGTVYTRLDLGGYVKDWRRFDRIDNQGRYVIRVCDTYLQVSRVVYTKYKGVIPPGMTVDHIDED